MIIHSLAFASAALLQAATPVQSVAPTEQMFIIAGTVVDATSHAPVARARVIVSAVETRAPEPGVLRQRSQSRSAITGADGTFGFLNIPIGKYHLSASLPSRSAQAYLSDGDQYSTAIVTGPEYDTGHLVFPFHMGGTITGSVADENGEPVQPQVHLFRKSILNGRESIVPAGASGSTSGGSFHFSHLQSGTYYLAINARPWYATHPFMAPHVGSSSPLARELDVAYPMTYYPGTTDFGSATPITVSDGSIANLQVAMRAVPSVHVSLPRTLGEREGSAQVAPSPSVMAIGPGGFLLPAGGMIGDGISGLAPGTYAITTSAPGQRGITEGARQIVHLTGDTTLEPVALTSPFISGKVTVEGPVKPTNRVVVALYGNGSNASATANADGTFDMKGRNLAAGPYRLVFPANPLFFIKDVTATGGTFTDGELELRDNSNVQLNIVLAQAAQLKLEGVVVQNGKPLPGAMVLLLPVKTTVADMVRRDQSDLDGSFALAGVPSGEYYLLAIDHGRDLAYRDKSVIRPYLAKASRIDVSAAKNDLKVEAQTRVSK